jgi:predicted amidohydrolase
MKVAAIQMVSGVSLDANLSEALRLLRQAAACGAELAVLPEYFCFMGHKDEDKLVIAETPGLGTVQDFLSDAARDLKLWVVGGTLPMATDDPAQASNASLTFNPKGRQVSRYDKIHLFRYDNGREALRRSRRAARGRHPHRLRPAPVPQRASLARRPERLLRPALCRAVPRAGGRSSCWCPLPSPSPPARPTGRCCCAPAPSRTRPS